MKEAREIFKTAAVVVGGIGPLSEKKGSMMPHTQRIGGLTVLERIFLSCRRAGVKKIVVAGLEAPEIPGLQEKRFAGLDLRFLGTGRGRINEKFVGGLKDAVADEAGWYLIFGDCIFESSALIRWGRNLPLPEGMEAVAAIRQGQDVPDFHVPQAEIHNDRVIRIRSGSEGRKDLFHVPGLFLCDRRLIHTMEEALGPGEGAESLEYLLQRVSGEGKMGFTRMEEVFLRHVGTKPALKETERLIFQSLVKKTDGFLARHINRRISLAITKFLVNTRVTPNQATLVNLMIGLMGALFMARGGYGSFVAGALLFQISSITDGCDGEIARLKFMESRFGGWLDILCDNLTHMAVFAGIAYGAYKAEPALYLVVCGWMAVLGTLMSFLLVAFQLAKKESGKGPFFVSVLESHTRQGSPLEGMLDWQDSLARRDFTYILLLFAIWGHIEVFLVLTAAGVNVFWMFLAYSLIRIRKTSSCI